MYSRHATSTRRATQGAVGVAALALMGTVLPSAPAAAEGFTQEELQTICATGKVGDWVEGTCTFEVQGESYETAWKRVGDPISNCNAGTTSDYTTTIVAGTSVSQTWKVSTGFEWEVGKDFKVEAGAEYGQTKTITEERREQITAKPGRKVALTVGTGITHQTGRMRVDTQQVQVGEWIPEGGTSTQYIDGVTRSVPNGYIERGQDEVSCAEDFRVPA